jgi:hypothetical protein
MGTLNSTRRGRNDETKRPRFQVAYFTPEIEMTVRHLLQYTKRTTTVFSLLGTPARDRDRQTTGIIRLLDEMFGEGTAERRPRGSPCQYDSLNFLSSTHDRHDASLLLALHRSGPEGLGARMPHLVDEQYQSTIQRIHGLTAIYSEYVRVSVPSGTKGRISFDTYLELLKGVKAHSVEMATCKCCGARHVYNPLNVTSKPACPFCARFVDVAKARSQLEARFRQRRAALNYG